MKIKLLGIELIPGQGITLADLFTYIQTNGNTGRLISNYKRYIYVDKKDGYHVGLLITAKDNKRFLEFFSDPQNAKLEARDVSKGANLADFNFFAINEKTGKGIYQYYHNSCSLNVFGYTCKQLYDELKQQRIDAAQQVHPKITTAIEKAINKQFKGSLTWETVVRKEAFKALVKELKSIQSVTFAVSTLAYEETDFSSLSHVANKMTQRYTFKKTSPVGEVMKGLIKVVDKADVDNAKVVGVGEDNLEKVVRLTNNPDSFGEFEFDDIASTMTISPSDFTESTFLNELIKAAKKAPALRAHK